jgi:hypothetical protein
MVKPFKHTVTEPLKLPSENTRALISIAIFAHLFVVVVCLAANLAPSTLEQRLMQFFQPYAELLNFDLDGTRYYLTHATIRDVDHRIEVLPAEAANDGEDQWVPLARGLRGGERYHRHQRFADAMSFFQDDEAMTALMAEGVARCCTVLDAAPVREVRLRQHLLQSPEAVRDDVPAQRDPDAANYFALLYRAHVVIGDRGQIRVLKREAASLEATSERRTQGARKEPPAVTRPRDAGE